MATLQEIEKLTEKYAGLMDKLAGQRMAMSAELEAVKKDHLQPITRLVERVAEAHEELRAAVEGSPRLFEKPKTQVLHGYRIGFRKAVDTVEFEDPDQVVTLIEKRMPDQADVLIIIEKKPNKTALLQLDPADLKKIACTFDEGDDVVMIKDAASDVDKIISALLKKAIEEVEA